MRVDGDKFVLFDVWEVEELRVWFELLAERLEAKVTMGSGEYQALVFFLAAHFIFELEHWCASKWRVDCNGHEMSE